MLPALRRRPPALLAVLASLAACSSPPAPPPPPPPPATQAPLPPFHPPEVAVEPVTDDYHGTRVVDPYRWLEDQDGERTAAFVQAQNTASRGFLDALPGRAELRARLLELWNFPRRSVPQRAGERWFHNRNDGLQNQSVWYVATSPDADGEVLFDPNTLSSDGTVALAGFVPSDDGALVAYAISTSGSDWQEWHVLDVATKTPRADTLRWGKFASAAWTHDGAGFFYQRFPAPAAGQTFQAKNQNAQLCYHRLGADQTGDRVVYERPDEPDFGFRPEVTEDGRFLIVAISKGTDRRNGIAYVDLQEAEWPVHLLLAPLAANWDFLDHDGDTFWFRTDQAAPRGRVVAIDRSRPQEAPRTLVPEGTDTLRGARRLGGRFVCHYLTDASSRAAVFGPDGTPAGELPLPAIGTLGAFSGKAADPVAFVAFHSFAWAPTVLRVDVANVASSVFLPSQLRFDTSSIVTERKFLQSHDGTRLCLFVVHKKGLRLDGTAPTYLYGYGGFDIAMTPTFSVQNLVLVERGGVYAQAVLRGGGEYGAEWHRAGMREKKQNVFDDFVACAEYLQRNGWCSARSLAIGGGSNGGLLVGAALTQRPELFGAAIPEVGVLDMLRYHRFTIGRAWAPEYGSSDDPQAFAWLYRYSPLHRVLPGTVYPPTLVMTGDHDDRVLPGHSYKFAAALQAAQAGTAPILLRVETAAGHGAGKPVQKLVDEAADRLAFLFATLRR